MAAVLKTVWAARLTGVQIPPRPRLAEKFRVSGSKRMYSHIRIRFFGAKDAVSRDFVLQTMKLTIPELSLVVLIGPSGFVFSSRRRHTIFDCDWSSDVCSSD